LGAAWYLPDERQITTYEQMIDELIATLGGRAAEDIVFGKISTGALNDLEKVTKQAYAMVAFYGLNKKIGNISYYDSSGQNEYSFSKPFSEETARVIDDEIHKMVEDCYSKAKQLLTDNREKLNQLAEILLAKEVIFREDLEKIFGKRLFDDHEHVMINGNGDTNEERTGKALPEIAIPTPEKLDEPELPPAS
jgi:cell division protease FtsH